MSKDHLGTKVVSNTLRDAINAFKTKQISRLVRGEIKCLIRNHGLQLGTPLIPDFNHLVVPKDQRTRRNKMIAEEQFEELVKALIVFMGFEDKENHKSVRTLRLAHRMPQTTTTRGMDQKLKRHLRSMHQHGEFS